MGLFRVNKRLISKLYNKLSLIKLISSRISKARVKVIIWEEENIKKKERIGSRIIDIRLKRDTKEKTWIRGIEETRGVSCRVKIDLVSQPSQKLEERILVHHH